MSDAARAARTALRSPFASARRSRNAWNQRAASHAAVVATYPSGGSCATIQTGSATASTIRSMLRTARIPTGLSSDVLKTCVDKPESQEKSDESARERNRYRGADRRAYAVAHSRAQDERDHDHQAGLSRVGGSGHGEVDPSAWKAKNPAWWSAGGGKPRRQRQDGAI